MNGPYPIFGTIRQWIGCFIVLSILVSPAIAQEHARIVAIGDVHGDVDALVSILRKAEVIDDQNKWIGGITIIVQLGDVLDRGLKGREVMDLYMSLETQAVARGGRVEFVLGNHEVMNFYNDLRYVTNYTPFTDEQSDIRRETAWQAFMDWQVKRGRILDKPVKAFTPEDKEKWMETHPRGYVERAEALASDGTYGAWLRSKPAFVRINDDIFHHASLSPEMASMAIEDMNETIAGEIALFDTSRRTLVEAEVILPFSDFDEIRTAVRAERKRLTSMTDLTEAQQKHLGAANALLGHTAWMSMRPDGPLWSRNFETWTEEEGIEQIAAIREAYGQVRFVVGHSPTQDRRIHARFNNSVFMIDSGMSALYYGGRPSALEIKEGGVMAIYKDGPEVLVAPEGPAPPPTPASSAATRASQSIWWGPSGQPLPFQDHETMMDFMRTADVVSMKDIGEGVTKPQRVLLEKDGIQMHTIFRNVHIEKGKTELGGRTFLDFRDDCIFEYAAYELSQILGFYNVPPVVPRKIERDEGTLQVWIEHAMTEKKRRQDRIAPVDRMRFNKEWQMIDLFDNLVFNDDRNSGNVVFDNAWGVWMIDHTRAFRLFDDLKDVSRLTQCERTIWSKLQTVEDMAITDVLKPYLRPYEIESLLKRRQKLISHIQTLIDEKGEDAVLFTW
jgi:hypothetical protein